MKHLDSDIYEEGLKLPLVEQFYSVQGEGFHTGKPAYFIRIGGCDIGCHWCDSKLTWNPEFHPLVAVKDIVDEVQKTPAQSIVVTGGEPSLYNLGPLCKELKKHNIKTYLETAGTNKITGEWDWICLSPKKQSEPLDVFYDKADELKFIIYEADDIKWAEETSKYVSEKCYLFLQPEWSQYKKIIQPIVDYVKNHPKWNVSLQAHKFMRIP